MSNLHGAWAGRIYGTNTGNIFIEFSQTEKELTGTARLHDDKFGIAIYEVLGTVADGSINLKGQPKETIEGVSLGEATIVADLKQDGSIAGRWETSLGSAGTLRLWPHNYEEKSVKGPEPEQIYNRTIPIGSVRLYKKDVKALFDVICKDFIEGKLIITNIQRENEVTKYASDFLRQLDDLEEISSLKMFIQEPEAQGINRMVNVDLFEKSDSAIRVSGINESWVVGKAESVKKEMSKYENSLITGYRKYGLNLNTVIFLLMLVLIPEIATWPKRLIFVSSVYVLLESLNAIHRKLIPNTVIFSESKPPTLMARSWPSLLSWLIAFSSSLVAAIIFWLLTKQP